MAANFSLNNDTAMVSSQDDDHQYWSNFTEWDPKIYVYIEQRIFSVFVIFVSIFGFLGNGFVIWLLGFCMKRNSFTIYILNLAVADVGVLISMAIFFAVGRSSSTPICEELIIFMYSTGQFLLTVISIDRCVCVLFPFWHQIHRPPHLSTVVCALIWILSFLLNAIHFTVLQMRRVERDKHLMFFQFFVNALLCVPLMTVSALTLFIKIFLKPQQRRRRKLLMAIFITLLFFLIFAFPLNAIYLLSSLTRKTFPSSMRYGLLSASLNSSVNPLIYFLVGRRKKKQPRGSMRKILQRIFEEE
ncbi:mas-related G-protein coupled receptor member H-like isoform X3 [Paroedura picta]|uniref:mas-related G-protein coupled receptor member H-like isoform X3 n=1 Tax=Paroedura picta TaxID=143630 RepID=UPI004057495B